MRDAEKLVEMSIRHARRTLIVSPPGMGKTSMVKQVTDRMNADFLTMCCPLQSPVKVGGYPQRSPEPGGDATHALFGNIARAFRATKLTVLLLDDLGMANGETLKSIIEFVQFGRIDDKVLPDCVRILGATNDVGHGADVQGLIEPLKNRWHTIVQLENNMEDLMAYALSRNWPDWLRAYIRNSPEVLNSWKPTKSMSPDGCTNRGLEYLAQWDQIGVDDPEVWSGCVGKGVAAAASAFKQMANELPDIDGVLMDPDNAPVPSNPSAKYLVSTAVSSRMNGSNFGACLRYLGRMDAIFRAFSIRDAFRAQNIRKRDGKLPKDWKPIDHSRDFVAWSVTDDGKEVMSAAS